MITEKTRGDPQNTVDEVHTMYFDTVRMNVSAMLKGRKMNLKEFAKQNDWHYSALHKALNDNHTISLFSLVRLANGLGVNVCDLLNGYDTGKIKKI